MNMAVESARVNRCRSLAEWLGRPGDFTVDEWLALLSRYDGKCVACGSVERITIDHVIPLRDDRSANRIANIQPLCFVCNTRKNKRLLDFRPDVLPRDGILCYPFSVVAWASGYGNLLPLIVQRRMRYILSHPSTIAENERAIRESLGHFASVAIERLLLRPDERYAIPLTAFRAL